MLESAIAALRRNRLRTSLTLLSLIIGVAAVIAMVALGAGARTAIETQVRSAGANLIIVSAGNWTTGGVRLGMGSSSRLTSDDAVAISREVSGIAAISPRVRARQQLINGRHNWSAMVEGVGHQLPWIRQWSIARGVFFVADHVRNVSSVSVLGAGVRRRLFDSDTDPIGRQIRIGSHIFTVIGVLSPKGQSSGGEDQDDAVFVPYTTAQKKLMGVTYMRNIYVSAATAEAVGHVAGEIRRLLRREHQIRPGYADDFRVRSLEEIVALRTRTVKTMTVLMSGVAAVSLIVAGVGVMNIMLVSVAERTREIGIRLAVGARSRDVRAQFLTEAGLISVFGGSVGVVAGVLFAKALTLVIGWPTDLDIEMMLATFVFVTLTGIFFGWYPASRAAGTDPIDALYAE